MFVRNRRNCHESPPHSIHAGSLGYAKPVPSPLCPGGETSIFGLLVAGGWWLVAGGCPRFAMPPEFVDQCHEAPRKPLAKYDLKGE